MKKIVISGSSSLREEMKKWLKYFQDKDFEILDWPVPINDEDFAKDWPGIHKHFYESIGKTDVHFIANEDKDGVGGYVGVGVFAEIAFAVGLLLSGKNNAKVMLYKEPSSQNHFYEDLKLWLENGWLEIFDESKL